MAPHSSTLAWKIRWTEKPGGLQSMGSLRVEHDWVTYFHALEKEMATHSSVLAWRIPGVGEPGGLLSMGSHRVGHDWCDLAAAAAAYSYITKALRYWKMDIHTDQWNRKEHPEIDPHKYAQLILAKNQCNSQRKESLFSKWYRNNWTFIDKRLNLN